MSPTRHFLDLDEIDGPTLRGILDCAVETKRRLKTHRVTEQVGRSADSRFDPGFEIVRQATERVRTGYIEVRRVTVASVIDGVRVPAPTELFPMVTEHLSRSGPTVDENERITLAELAPGQLDPVLGLEAAVAPFSHGSSLVHQRYDLLGEGIELLEIFGECSGSHLQVERVDANPACSPQVVGQRIDS